MRIIAQRFAAIVVGIVLAFFVFIVGIGLFYYPRVVQAMTAADMARVELDKTARADASALQANTLKLNQTAEAYNLLISTYPMKILTTPMGFRMRTFEGAYQPAPITDGLGGLLKPLFGALGFVVVMILVMRRWTGGAAAND